MALSSHDRIFLLPLMFLLLLPVSAFAQNNNGNIRVGASLTATENSSPWLSPSGDFAFGFQQLQKQNDLFLLSIWYNKIPDKTIVWYANNNPPPMAPAGSKVSLTSDRGLVLTNPQGEELWKSENIIADVAQGVMTDQGNFILRDRSSETLWETFKYPRDTLLPTQLLERGGKLASRQAETNFTRGRFELALDDGNLILYIVNLPTEKSNTAYYASFTGDGDNPSNLSNAGKQLVFNESSGSIYVLRKTGEILSVAPGDMISTKDNYIGATINFDGVFTQYYHPKNGSGRWTYLWSIPDDICQPIVTSLGTLGTCGYNSICTLQQENRPTCMCPRKYTLIDPNDAHGGCKPDFIWGCKADELARSEGDDVRDLYDVVELINTDWSESEYIELNPFTADLCKESCLNDCFCAVAIFRAGSCRKKKLPLSNGRVDASFNSRGFIKVRKAEYSNLPDGSDHGPVPEAKREKDTAILILVGSVLFGTSVFVNILLVTAGCVGFFFCYRKKYFLIKICPNRSIVMSSNLRHFFYEELTKATNSFREELGRGSCGIVYKGVIDQSRFVAVKALDRMFQDNDKEFQAEVNVIGHTHHKNLVRLIGYCNQKQHKLLVYEFMGNGTLADFLFGGLRPRWYLRVDIAFGIARGLVYLHEECSTQIIHCDIKPQNILLDEYYNARISDFGLAKILEINQSHTKTIIRGTKGYAAPDWFRSAPITVKVDVYSFGVLLLEIICCRRNVFHRNDEEVDDRVILVDWANDCYLSGRLDALIENDTEAMSEIEMVKRIVMVAFWCIQEDPSVRPTMKNVMLMLEGIIQVSAPPSLCLSSSMTS